MMYQPALQVHHVASDAHEHEGLPFVATHFLGACGGRAAIWEDFRSFIQFKVRSKANLLLAVELTGDGLHQAVGVVGDAQAARTVKALAVVADVDALSLPLL